MVLCMGLDQAVVRYYYEKENLKYKQALLFRCIVIPIIASLIIGHIHLEQQYEL